MDPFSIISSQVNLFIFYLRDYILAAEKNVFIVLLVNSFTLTKGLSQTPPQTFDRINQQDLRVDAFHTSNLVFFPMILSLCRLFLFVKSVAYPFP